MPGPALQAVSMIVGGLQHTLGKELAAERRVRSSKSTRSLPSPSRRAPMEGTITRSHCVSGPYCNRILLAVGRGGLCANANYIITLSP